MDVSQSWKLKRYGCLVPGPGVTKTVSWKVYEAKAKKPDIILTIVESGYLMIFQGKESLTTVPLSRDSDHVKVHQKSDNLMLRFTMKGESRIIRMQFGGKREEAQKACSSAMEKLMEYLPVTSHEDAPLPPNQTPAEVFAPVMQDSAVGVESEVVRGSLSLKELAQHFLGETAGETLPLMYRHSSLAQGDFETVVRVCLLDPSFPAFVEKVEGELKKLLQE